MKFIKSFFAIIFLILTFVGIIQYIETSQASNITASIFTGFISILLIRSLFKKSQKSYAGILRKIFGWFFLIESVFSIFIAFTELKEHIIIGLITSLFFGGIAFLLLKPKKTNLSVYDTTNSIQEPIKEKYTLETPKETLDEMQKVQENIHANELIQIIQDSYALCQNTTNLQTFESRLELATRYAYTLKQMEQAKLYNANPTSDYFLDILIGNRDNLVNSFLKKSFYAELSKAKNELKSQNGIIKRMNKFFTEIEDSILDFDENLISILKQEL